MKALKKDQNTSRFRTNLNVLIVDDSAVVRDSIVSILSQVSGINVTAAADPLIAKAKMKRVRPDVIILDLELPRMDGLTFLRNIMAEDPIPVVVCSGNAERGTEAAFRALEEGAVQIVTKPKLGVRDFLQESAARLVSVVQEAAQVRLKPRCSPVRASQSRPASATAQSRETAQKIKTRNIVAIGASTGGTEALRSMLAAMPPASPGILIVQHMPEGFTKAFARQLNQTCQIKVKEAAQGDRVAQGLALIAPGNHHLLLHRNGSGYSVEVADSPAVSGHRPSVDVLFRSVAQAAGANALGVIMTGMGSDGAAGLLEMRRAGAATIAQDEATCVVFGMPKEAIAAGAVEEVLSLPEISARIAEVGRSK